MLMFCMIFLHHLRKQHLIIIIQFLLLTSYSSQISITINGQTKNLAWSINRLLLSTSLPPSHIFLIPSARTNKHFQYSKKNFCCCCCCNISSWRRILLYNSYFKTIWCSLLWDVSLKIIFTSIPIVWEKFLPFVIAAANNLKLDVATATIKRGVMARLFDFCNWKFEFEVLYFCFISRDSRKQNFNSLFLF